MRMENKDIFGFDIKSAFRNVVTVGKTTLGREILMISKGKGARVLVVGGVHAREHITSKLLAELMLRYEGDYAVDCIPALNPDGILLAKNGLNSVNNAEIKTKLQRINGNSTDFSLWKANARGVDINVNFDALWGKGEGSVFYPSPSSYVGEAPESEPETRAAAELLRTGRYTLVVAYHSKGEEVYWGFNGDYRYKNEAARVANYLGYRLKTTPNSAGGLKDYWTAFTGKLGLTIEVGKDYYPHPYPESELGNLIKTHSRALELFGRVGEELWIKYGL